MPPKKPIAQVGGQMKLSFAPSKPASKQKQDAEQPESKAKDSANPKESPSKELPENMSKKRNFAEVSKADPEEKKEEPTERKIDSSEKESSPAKKGIKKQKKDLLEEDDEMEAVNKLAVPAKTDQKVNSSKPSSKMSLKAAAEKDKPGISAPLKDYGKLKTLEDLGFCPKMDSPQQQGQRMPFSMVVRALQLIEKQEGKNSRTAIIEIISNVFRSALANYPSELADIFYFFIVKLAPDFASMETGVGHEVSVKAIAKACGKAPKEIRELYKEEGDLGTVVQKSKSTLGTLGGFFKTAASKEKKILYFNHVFSEFRRIAKTSGSNSAATKEGIIVKLLQDGSNDEAKYIVRFLQKTLKTGAAEKTVLSALARAVVYTPPNKDGVINQKQKIGDAAFLEKCEQVEHAIKQAICESPDYEKVINALMIVGDRHEELKDSCHIQVGVPVKPMLAKPTKGVHVVLQRFQGIEFTCEYKYDGFRGQIHYNKAGAAEGKDCFIYSRNLENMSVAYPDVLDIIRKVAAERPDLDNFILDSELIAYDLENEKILPFQNLTQRSRKHVNEEDLKTKIAIQAFDLLYLNGKALLKDTLEVRRKTLHDRFSLLPGQFMFAKGVDTANFEDLEQFLDKSIKDCCEGLMVKTLNVNSTYEPSKRSFNWLKLKKDYLEGGLGDSVDLVVIGADHGSGKRAGWFGSYLLASWNEDLECFQTVCKVGTGLSDEQLASLKPKLDEISIKNPASNLKIKDNNPQVKCDVYFEPKYVWEIKAADLSLSPMHTACLGKVEEGKGIALRFPRLIRERDDKEATDCTSTEQIEEMYRAQAAVQVNFNDGEEDFDF